MHPSANLQKSGARLADAQEIRCFLKLSPLRCDCNYAFQVTSETLPSSSSLMNMDLAKSQGDRSAARQALFFFPEALGNMERTFPCFSLLQTLFGLLHKFVSGVFVGSRFPDPDDMTWAIYEFNAHNLLKGPVSWGLRSDLYTQLLGTTCAYRHDGPFTDEVYVVGGERLARLQNGETESIQGESLLQRITMTQISNPCLDAQILYFGSQMDKLAGKVKETTIYLDH
ncbi:UNVERIFIED_CONTAM: hypothetical protein K2H54_047543 [Gekko kuhli]